MSVAERFLSLNPFPWCLGVPDSNPYQDFVGNLTLDQVMAFWWNLEDVAFTFNLQTFAHSHTVSPDPPADFYAHCSGTISFKTLTLSGDFSNFTHGDYSPSAMLEPSGGIVPVASLGTTRVPKARVMEFSSSQIAAVMAHFQGPFADHSGYDLPSESEVFHFYPSIASFLFRPYIDPDNAGKYGIVYEMRVQAGSNLYATARFVNPSAPSLYPTIHAGTFTIAGITFNYEAQGNDTVLSGGTMSASSTLFTYP